MFYAGLINGGPSGLVYGYIFAWVGVFAQALVMAELTSMSVNQSSVSYLGADFSRQDSSFGWTIQLVKFLDYVPSSPLCRIAVLSPKSCSKFLSYLTGWITLISWQAAFASGPFLGGTMIQGLLVLNHPSYNYQRWHGTLIFYAIIAISLFVNMYLAPQLPKIEAMVLVIHIMGFFGVLIPLVYLAPHNDPRDVFASFIDGGGWDSYGLSFFVGLSASMFTLIGQS